MAIDCVIPVGPNDVSIIDMQLQKTLPNIIGLKNTYLICPPHVLTKVKHLASSAIHLIDETIFPFSIETVAAFHGKNTRNGWYLQQLLKLYAGEILHLDRYLVVDSDTFFLKPISFIDDDGRSIYAWGTEYHRPYFHHMNYLHPSLRKMDQEKSGICHHMVFETKYVKEIMELVEANHSCKPFYQIFLTMPGIDVDHSGASEYELYFHYMLHRHPDQIVLRYLEWKNIRIFDQITDDLDYISWHWYCR